MKRLLLSLIIIVILVHEIVVLPSCANIIPPEGGPRDSTPPQLVSISPPDSSVNSTDKQIVLTFDEFVDLNALNENLIVSPTPLVFPEVRARLRTVTVTLKDSLEANTTYTIDFGRAIRDINEGNPIEGLKYVFSTGPTIDSLQLSGKVILAENGDIDTTLIVMLHRNLTDSAVMKERPRYFTKLDGRGNFTFRNLPAGTFAVYALKDETGTKIYQPPAQLFAFLNEPVTIGAVNPAVTLYAYRETATSNRGLPSLPGRGQFQDNRLRFTTNLDGNLQDLAKDFSLIFEQPLRNFDSTLLTLTTDSLFNPASGYRFILDTGRKRVDMVTEWKENTTYNLILGKDFAEDTTGKKLLKTDTLSFVTRQRSEYGSMRIRFRNLDLTKNTVVQLVQNDNVLQSIRLTQGEAFIPLLLPGDYNLRVLYDDNNNGKWDPGQFFGVKRQPELVQPIERAFNIKANFDNEFEVLL